MSDPRDVRRFGRQNRKDALPPVPPLFPVEDGATQSEPDFMALLPDTDQEALATLAQLPPDAVRPLKITPQEQRFPPLPPPTPARQTQPAPPPIRVKQPTAKSGQSWVYNLITLFACSATLGLTSVFGIIWVEPQSVLNPFPPDVLFVYVTATPNTIPDALTVAATPTASVPSAYPFVATDTGVVYTANANGRGCEWASIAGTVTAKDGAALNGYRVRVTADNFDETVFTGAALTFGAGGFEMPLGNAPQNMTYTVQLFSPQGAPLSDTYSLTTRAECDLNVAILNFVQNRDL